MRHSPRSDHPCEHKSWCHERRSTMCLPVEAPRTNFAPHSSRLSDDSGESAGTALSKGDDRMVVGDKLATRSGLESDSLHGPSANPEIARALWAEPEIAARDRTDRETAVASEHPFFRGHVQLDKPKDSRAQFHSRRPAVRIRTLHTFLL